MSFKKRLAALDHSVYASTRRKAELGLLQPFLGVELIADLWAEGTEFSEEGYLELLKENIRDGHLSGMTFGQWKEAEEKEKKEECQEWVKNGVKQEWKQEWVKEWGRSKLTT